jgi:signal peptidase I
MASTVSQSERSPRPGAGRGQAAGRAEGKAAPKRKSKFREYVEAIVIAVLMALVFRQFVVQAFRIPSGSMKNTLLVGDFLFVNKFLYGAQIPWTSARLPAIREPRRGDIIVFKAPTDGRDFIKRCVAVAGDTLLLHGQDLYINGKLQDEPYAHYDPRIRERRNYGPIVIKEGNLFMMGDNRDNSQDSRYWGELDVHRVKGKAIFIYFSLADLDERGFGWTDFLPPRVRLSRIGDVIR